MCLSSAWTIPSTWLPRNNVPIPLLMIILWHNYLLSVGTLKQYKKRCQSLNHLVSSVAVIWKRRGVTDESSPPLDRGLIYEVRVTRLIRLGPSIKNHFFYWKKFRFDILFVANLCRWDISFEIIQSCEKQNGKDHRH